MKKYCCVHRHSCFDYDIDHCEGCGNFSEGLELKLDIGSSPIFEEIKRIERLTDSTFGINMSAKHPRITNVKFNPPATIVFWSDKTKTVVKAQDDEPFDPEKGLAMAMVKKFLGNKGNYFNEISKWTKQYYEYDAPAIEIDLRSSNDSMAAAFEELVKTLRGV